MGRAAGACLAAALWLSGCAHYQPRPIDPAVTAEAFATRTLDAEPLHQFLLKTLPPARWPLAAWDLDHLTGAAIFEKPDLAVARAQWAVANAGIKTAGQRPNPDLSASGTYDTTTAPPWIPAVSFDLPIETAGKRGIRLDQARAAAEAGRWDWVGKLWEVRAGVRTALLGVYDARENAGLLQRQVAAQSEMVRLLEGQLKAGAIAQTDVMQARIALNTSRLALQQAHQQVIEATAALADAVGLPVSALSGVKLSFAGLDRFPDPLPPATAQREAVLRRADVRGALANYAASQAALRLEIANQYPDLHLGPGYELDQTDNKWTLGLTFTLPILNQNQGPIADATARRQLAAAQFLATQAKAINEVAMALASYTGARAQAATAAALLQQIRQRLESARQMQQAGEIDRLAVASAEVEYINGALAHLDAVFKAGQALGRLEAAVQSPAVLPAATIRQAETVPSHEP